MRRLGTEFLNHPSRDKSAESTTAPARRVATVTVPTRVGTLRTVLPAVLAVALTVVLLASCGNGGRAETLDGAPSDAATPAAPSGLAVGAAVSGPVANQVLYAYAGYWTAQIRAMATGRADGTNLPSYAVDAALSESYADVVRLVANGQVMSGTPRNQPTVTAIGPLPGVAGENQATLVDCLDVSGWHQVNVRDGQLNEPAGRLTRYRLKVIARTVGGVWMISQITRETGASC